MKKLLFGALVIVVVVFLAVLAAKDSKNCDPQALAGACPSFMLAAQVVLYTTVLGMAGCLLAIIGDRLPGWVRLTSLIIGLVSFSSAFLIAEAL